ncbi:ankyrin repeat and LEM domain-containing protein 2 isoform X2 [Narcine bancroftii]|uniref:ankyrin repeat and LEM domain-containing protein 2 isoform X2 n=1 Tax=Narcine bancroftii TaxID=1343680 RepID=UPI0038315DF6
MEAILNRLQQLTTAELRQEILGAGLYNGPITSTTRHTLEKKLAQVLLERQGEGDRLSEPISSSAKPEDNSALCSLPTSGSECSSVACSLTTHSPCDTCVDKDKHFGYDVGVIPPDESMLSDSLEAVDESSIQNNSEQPSDRSKASAAMYYGVCTVWDDGLPRNDKVHVYLDKNDALRATRMMKGSRFKAFTNKEDAEKFSKGICDYCPSPSKSTASVSPLKGNVIHHRDCTSSLEAEGTNRGRANIESPRSQDLTSKLRKAIEKGDSATFLELVWSNPCYLIGSGDNPTVLQEGCRYNAMHVSAKENQPQICQLLLETLENPEFMLLLYPDDDEVMLEKRIKYIVDLYLNTPDKRVFDTPLHFACKFGHAEVVKVLCSHPAICKVSKNRFDCTPVEVICERKQTKSEEVKNKIREYLQDRYYVPLLRDIDNSSPPVIGPPWSPDRSDNQPLYKHTGNPKDPVMAVRAFAGPMTPCKASEFRRVWKTPSRESSSQYKKADAERGYERVGRNLAHEMGHPWSEYWEFLDCFIDLAAPEGIRKVEDYLSKRESSKKSEQKREDLDICNRFKSSPPSGKSSKQSNSISIGAFLDSFEEIKNRQNAALKDGRSAVKPGNSFGAIEENESHILPFQHTTGNMCNPDKDNLTNLNGVGSSIDENPAGRCPRSFTIPRSADDLFPISNLKADVQNLSLLDDREKNLLSNRLIESPEKPEIEVKSKLLEDNPSVLVGCDKVSDTVCNHGTEHGKAEYDELTEIELKNEDELLVIRPNQQQARVDGGDEITGPLSCISKMATLQLENKQNLTQHSTLSCQTDNYPTLKREVSAHCSTLESTAIESKLNSMSDMQLGNICRSSEGRQQVTSKQTPGYSRKGLNKGTFLVGDEPTKVDSDVLAALSSVDVDPQKFPCVHRWKDRMQSYSVSEMQSWPSPTLLKGKPKGHTTSSSPCSPHTSVLGRPHPPCYSPGKFGSPGHYSSADTSHIQVQQHLHFIEPSEL